MISLLLIEFVIIRFVIIEGRRNEKNRRYILSLTLKLLRHEHVFLQLANNL